MREWAKFWSDYDAKVKAYLKILHGHADNYEVLWVSDTSEGDWDHHPGRDAHRVVADSIFNAFQRLADGADGARCRRCGERALTRRAGRAVGFCQHMTATISADVEDVPTKPGWIWDGGPRRPNGTAPRRLAPARAAEAAREARAAEEAAAAARRCRGAARRDDELVRRPLRRDRRVGVEFLKSYDRMGAVELTIASHDGMHSSKKSGVLYRSDAQQRIIRGADEDAVARDNVLAPA
ncbi:hypothetical protein JL720_16641 [Aureococcus anophagefferens]|nr:hypothetical protein JL720_16641 [Aureococcus anophagefferens]